MLYTVSDLFISFDLVVSIYGSLLWEEHEHTLWGFLWVGHIFLYFGSLFFVCLPLQFCFAIVSLVPFLYILRPYHKVLYPDFGLLVSAILHILTPK